MKFICECNGVRCGKTVEIDGDEYYKAVVGIKHFIVVDGCSSKPLEGDMIIERRAGYTIQEGKKDW